MDSGLGGRRIFQEASKRLDHSAVNVECRRWHEGDVKAVTHSHVHLSGLKFTESCHILFADITGDDIHTLKDKFVQFLSGLRRLVSAIARSLIAMRRQFEERDGIVPGPVFPRPR